MTQFTVSPNVDALTQRKHLRMFLTTLAPRQAVVLVGSWPRHKATPRWSDIDLLVIGGSPPPHASNGLQVIFMTASDFEGRTMRGDDFTQWALRFGVPLTARDTWRQLKAELLPLAPWPDYHSKLSQAKTRLNAAKELLAMGDVEAAEEEMRYALSHLARGKLLQARTYPLSKQELPEQLQALGERRLASTLERVNSVAPMNASEVSKGIGLAFQILEEMGNRSVSRVKE
jgi:hypothetical protein